MKARDVVGRRIVAVVQHRDSDAIVQPCVELDELVLDNGARIRFLVSEGEISYHVEGLYVAPPAPSAQS